MLIMELLADGKRMPSAELEKAVNERGISSRTMRTAKSRIGYRLVTEKDGTAWVCTWHTLSVCQHFQYQCFCLCSLAFGLGGVCPGKLKDSPTTRVLIHEKSSLAPPGQSLAFSLGDVKGSRVSIPGKGFRLVQAAARRMAK